MISYLNKVADKPGLLEKPEVWLFRLKELEKPETWEFWKKKK